MEDNKLYSEQMSEFIKMIRDIEPRYNLAKEEQLKEKKRTQDYLHAIEFSQNAKDRNRIATKLKACREERRRNKDIVEELEPIVEWLNLKGTKDTMNHLTQALGKVRKAESYHNGNKVYHPRIEDTQ